MREEGALVRIAIGVFVVVLAIAAVAWAASGGSSGGAGEGDRADREARTAAAGEDAPARDGDGGKGKDDGEGKGGGDEDAAAPAGAACRVLGAPAELPDDVHEASGVAVSRALPGTLWTHSDSGEPQVVAVSADGTVRGRVRIAGAEVRDWEDAAVGACPGGSCLYLADIGDNRGSRERVTVYRVPEPDPARGESAPAEAFHATYPDGPHDAEALFVTADGGIHLVTKGETGPVAVYRFPRPLRPGSTARLEHVATLGGADVKRSGRVTGAAASPDGRWVALRTLRTVTLYRAGDLAAGRAQEAARFDLEAAGEAQGEGIAFGPDGTLYLASEGGKKKDPATLSWVSCPLPG